MNEAKASDMQSSVQWNSKNSNNGIDIVYVQQPEHEALRRLCGQNLCLMSTA